MNPYVWLLTIRVVHQTDDYQFSYTKLTSVHPLAIHAEFLRNDKLSGEKTTIEMCQRFLVEEALANGFDAKGELVEPTPEEMPPSCAKETAAVSAPEPAKSR